MSLKGTVHFIIQSTVLYYLQMLKISIEILVHVFWIGNTTWDWLLVFSISIICMQHQKVGTWCGKWGSGKLEHITIHSIGIGIER